LSQRRQNRRWPDLEKNAAAAALERLYALLEQYWFAHVTAPIAGVVDLCLRREAACDI